MTALGTRDERRKKAQRERGRRLLVRAKCFLVVEKEGTSRVVADGQSLVLRLAENFSAEGTEFTEKERGADSRGLRKPNMRSGSTDLNNCQ
jgi:hypothetical protein